MLLCVATNGLGLSPHVPELADLETGHVTVTVNAVDPEIGAKIYRFVRLNRHLYRGIGGAELLLARQLEGIRALKSRNVAVKINTIVIPGVNDTHIEEVAQRMADLGADVHNCIPLYPVPGTPFGKLAEPDAVMMATVRAGGGRSMKQMTHCARCRADAAGILGEDNHELVRQVLEDAARFPLAPEQDRPYTAVASLEGMLVNQHLGEAEQFWIFSRDADGQFHPVETRPAPLPGGGDDRWGELGNRLADCRALICSSAGQRPKMVLAARRRPRFGSRGIDRGSARCRLWWPQTPDAIARDELRIRLRQRRCRLRWLHGIRHRMRMKSRSQLEMIYAQTHLSLAHLQQLPH